MSGTRFQSMMEQSDLSGDDELPMLNFLVRREIQILKCTVFFHKKVLPRIFQETPQTSALFHQQVSAKQVLGSVRMISFE